MIISSQDAERIPVIIASGESIERGEPVTPIDLMARACEAAFADVGSLRHRLQQVSVVDIMTHTGPAPATELAARLGLAGTRCEVTTIGGNSPQWLVNRAASAISNGTLSATVIAGAEAIRSSRLRRQLGLPRDQGDTSLGPDPVVGDGRPGVGPAEAAIGLLAPVHVYPLFESVVAARAGHTSVQHREALGEILAPFTRVAAANPFAWFPVEYSAQEIASPSADNRIVCEPYTKRMTAFLGSDQGGALVVCSLAEARRAKVDDRSIFVWAGADAVDVRFPASRPDPGTSPAIAAAARALFEAVSAGPAAGNAGDRGSLGRIGIDDVEVLDLYSCFPVAVEVAAAAIGVVLDDPRGLTSTGGLPYFGGPGNNYTTHGVASVTSRLREAGGGSVDDRRRLGLATGLGWFITKHSLGLYGSTPPPGGFHLGDTTADQRHIDDGAVETVLEVPDVSEATVVAITVIRDHAGAPTGAPAITRLPDGRHVAASPADEETVVELGRRDTPGMVGTRVFVEGGPPRYRLPER